MNTKIEFHIKKFLIEKLRMGYPLRSKAKGNSMSPFIREGDIITIKPIEFHRVRIGDIVALERDDKPSWIIAHRVIMKRKNAGQCYLVTKSDNFCNLQPDHPVYLNNFLGKVSLIEKDGKLLNVEKIIYRLYGYGYAIMLRYFSRILEIMRQGVKKILKRKGVH